MNNVERSRTYVAIAGPSGNIKSDIAKKLAFSLGFAYLQEQRLPNTHPDGTKFQALTDILTKKIQQIKTAEKQFGSHAGFVLETPPQEIVYAHGRAYMQGYNYGLFQSLFESLQPFLISPSLVVCLEADAQKKQNFNYQIDYNHEWIFALQKPSVHIHMKFLNGSGFDYQALANQIRVKLNTVHD